MAEAAKDISEAEYESWLEDLCERYFDDPLSWVRAIYPWGEAGTFLAEWDGPDVWQAETLTYIGECVKAGKRVWLARASGHGIGKSALIAWIIHWFMSTRRDPQIITTANTKIQLESKTWRELAKWQKIALNGHWFEHTATKYIFIREGVKASKTYFASAIPWSKERSEAFAGTHEKHVLMLFDEGSAVDDVIYEVAEGAMTTPGSMFIVFGNPTRNTGRFYEIFHKQRHLWNTAQIDSRDTKVATLKDKELFERWVDAYGEDSDFVRVRCRGLFPRAGVMQFIGNDIVEAAAEHPGYHRSVYDHAPKILGVDVAGEGDDQSVIIRRQGIVASGLRKFRELNTMQLASIVAAEIEEWEPDAVFVDMVGIGAGVLHRLHQLKHKHVIGVNAGHKAGDDQRYFNKRAEMWGDMKDWLEAEAMIPNDQELRDDLTGPEYGHDARERIQLERKVDMKLRGLASPDSGDALGFTFAQPVSKTAQERALVKKQRKKYDPRGNNARRFGTA